MVASIELLTENPTAGDWVEFRVRASDADATPLRSGVWRAAAGEDPGLNPGNCFWHGADEGFGPWIPPSRRPGSFDYTESSRFTQPGTYRVYACVASSSWPRYAADATDEEVQTWCPGDPEVIGFEGFVCRDPYGSFAAPYVEVVIAPAP